MGFHVGCAGAELLRQLRQNANGFLNEPYSLYFVALATALDDDALTWLHKHEMQMDSLCGPYAASLLFYNKASVRAEPIPRLWSREFDDAKSLVTIEVNPRILGGGSASVDHALRFNPIAQTEKDILIRSMTYESDAVARELGIIDRLPCFVIFDDPSADIFYVLSLSSPDDSTFRDLRILISAFVNDPTHVEYFSILRRWHTENSALEALRVARRDILTARPCNPAFIYSELNRAREMLVTGRVKEFRATVNIMESQSGNVGRLRWKLIRMVTTEIGVASSLYQKIRSTRVPEAHRTAACQRAALLTRASSVDMETVITLLQNYIVNKADYVIEVILDSLALGKLDSLLPESVRILDEQIGTKASEVQAIGINLASRQRPVLAKHFARLQKDKRAKTMIYSVRRVAAETTSRIPSLLDVVQKGVELFS